MLAVRLWDPRENELPDIGLVLMQDAETGEQLYVDTHDRRFRLRFAEAAQRRQADLDAAFRHAGVDVLSLSTEDDLVRAIVQFAAQRKQHKQIAGQISSTRTVDAILMSEGDLCNSNGPPCSGHCS